MSEITIIINSSNRPAKQITYKNLIDTCPSPGPGLIKVAVPHDQLAAYKEAGQVAPEDLWPLPADLPPYLPPQRQWCIENCPTRFAFIMDDDLKIGTVGYGIFSKKPAYFQTCCSLVNHVMDHLAVVPLVGISTRYGNHLVLDEYRENGRISRCYALDTHVFKELGVDLAPFPDFCMEDFHLSLSFLSAGKPNRVLYYYWQDDAGSNSKGGCSAYRTPEVQERSARWLAERWPDYVRLVEKKTKGNWQGFEQDADGNVLRTDVVVQWKKAWKDATRQQPALALASTVPDVEGIAAAATRANEIALARQASFDFEAVGQWDDETRDRCLETVKEELAIRGPLANHLGRMTTIQLFEIGKLLDFTKVHLLKHGQYESWAERNFGHEISKRLRSYGAQIYRKFKDHPEIVAQMPSSVVRELAQPKCEAELAHVLEHGTILKSRADLKVLTKKINAQAQEEEQAQAQDEPEAPYEEHRATIISILTDLTQVGEACKAHEEALVESMENLGDLDINKARKIRKEFDEAKVLAEYRMQKVPNWALQQYHQQAVETKSKKELRELEMVLFKPDPIPEYTGPMPTADPIRDRSVTLYFMKPEELDLFRQVIPVSPMGGTNSVGYRNIKPVLAIIRELDSGTLVYDREADTVRPATPEEQAEHAKRIERGETGLTNRRRGRATV